MWMHTGDSWNQTLTDFTYDGQTIIQSIDLVSVMIELGYPYIGMSERFYDRMADALTGRNREVECDKGDHWGQCRVAN